MDMLVVENVAPTKYGILCRTTATNEDIIGQLQKIGELETVDRIYDKQDEPLGLILVQFQKPVNLQADTSLKRIFKNTIQKNPTEDDKRIRFVTKRGETTESLYQEFRKYGQLDYIYSTLTQNGEKRFGFARYIQADFATKAIAAEKIRGCWLAEPQKLSRAEMNNPHYVPFQKCKTCNLEISTKNIKFHNQICELQANDLLDTTKMLPKTDTTLIPKTTNDQKTITTTMEPLVQIEDIWRPDVKDVDISQSLEKLLNEATAIFQQRWQDNDLLPFLNDKKKDSSESTNSEKVNRPEIDIPIIEVSDDEMNTMQPESSTVPVEPMPLGISIPIHQETKALKRKLGTTSELTATGSGQCNKIKSRKMTSPRGGEPPEIR